jgi:endogenous inhibitor of DNA gyrase (YacG/DUF329 family)
MGAVGVYYRREMQRMLLGYGCCIICEREFETSDETNAHYPYISPVCKHTLCKLCLDKTISRILVREYRTVDCPFCCKENAWNRHKLVPNRALVSLLDDMRHVITMEGKDEFHQGGGDDGNNNGSKNGTSNDGDDDGGKSGGGDSGVHHNDDDKNHCGGDGNRSVAMRRKR